MIKSCKIVNVDGVVSVFNEDGSSSSLYKEALEYTKGDSEKALKIWSVTKTELWDEQMDSKENPSLKEVLRFIDNLPLLDELVPKLSNEEIHSVKSLMKGLGIQSLSDFTEKMNNLFQPKGYFEIDQVRLMKSGMYSYEDIQGLNVSKIKNFISRLNIESVINDFSIEDSYTETGNIKFKDLTKEVSVIGVKPFLTIEDIAQTIAEITDDFSTTGVETALVNTDFAEGVDNKDFVKRISNYLSTKKKVIELHPTSQSKTESVVKNTIIQSQDTIELEESLDFLDDILPEVWESNQDKIKSVVKDVVTIAKNMNVDIVGLQEITQNKEAVLDVIEATINLINNPNDENISEFSQIKDLHITPESTTLLKDVNPIYKDYTIRSVSSNQTQDELFENNSLIKVGEELYHQVDRTATKQELYDEVYNRVILGEIILDRKFFNDSELNLKDPVYKTEVMDAITRWVNSRNIGVVAPIHGEEISLYQVLFNHAPIEDISDYQPLSGEFSEDYLRTKFVSDFYNFLLSEKLGNTDLYKNVLKFFSIGDGDIYFNAPHKVDISGMRYENELRDYAKLKKEGQIKEFAENTEYINEDVKILNNPNLASELEGTDFKVFNDGWLVTKRNNPNNYITTGGNLYRKLYSEAEGSVYGKINPDVSNIYKDLDLDFSYDKNIAKSKLQEARKEFSPIKAKELEVIKRSTGVSTSVAFPQYSEQELNQIVSEFPNLEYNGKKFDTKQQLLKYLQMEGVLDQLMKTNLAKGYEIMSSEEIRNKLIELGVDADVAFQIIGEIGARNLDAFDNGNRLQNLEIAKSLVDSVSMEDIWKQTGWYLDAEGKWKTEILDGEHKTVYVNLRPIQRFDGYSVDVKKLKDLYQNDTLFKAYDGIENTEVVIYDGGDNRTPLAYNSTENMIIINIHYYERGENGRINFFGNDKVRAGILHELQHYIQTVEGFTRGGSDESIKQRIKETIDFINNPNGTNSEQLERIKEFENVLRSFLNGFYTFQGGDSILDSLKVGDNLVNEIAHNMYRSLGGEVEARNVQRRFIDDLSDNFPISTQDTLNISKININFQQNGVTLLPNGFYHNGKVYINQDTANLDTPIHEFSHAYNQLLKNEKPAFYQEGLRLIEKEGQQYIDFVKANQPNLQGEALLEEALAQAVGDAGAKLIEAEKSTGLKQWLQNAWNKIKEMLGLSSYTIEQVRNMSLQEYTNAVAVDLLRGEEVNFKTPSEEYFERNADRLPLTLAVFNRPEFKAMQGKMVNPITVLNSLNQSGIKQIEKDLIKQIIQDNYQGQNKISYDELEATVRANIMPLERIFTSSYADYGMDNLGDGNYGEANTIILNSPIEHGVTGHFSGAFKASGRKNIKYVPKQLNDNVWVAVEEGYESQANNNNIYQFVGTAGTKEAVERWIDEYESYDGISSKDFAEIEELRKKGQLTEKENKRLVYLLNKGVKSEINKGMFGHIRVWQDGQDFYVAELQSDYFQKNNAKKNIKLKVDYSKLDSDFHKKVRNAYERLGYTYNKKTGEVKNPNNEVLDEFVPDDDFIVLASMEIDNNPEISEVKKKLQDTYKKDRIRLEEEALKNRPLQEKQFIASQKEWEKRMVREAIKEASLSGATSLRFPTPYTLSVIEGYVKNEDSDSSQLPYTIITKDLQYDSEYLDETGNIVTLEVTDVININGESYVVVDVDGSEIIVKNVDIEKSIKYNEDIFREEFGEDVRIGVHSVNGVQYSYNGIGMINFLQGSSERFYQPSKYVNQKAKKSWNFNISDLSDTQQTVARKYEEIAEILKAERGDNFEVITDENGFDWYETKLATEEINNPVIAFQVISSETNDIRYQIEVEQQKLDNKVNEFKHMNGISLNITIPQDKLKDVKEELDSCAI